MSSKRNSFFNNYLNFVYHNTFKVFAIFISIFILLMLFVLNNFVLNSDLTSLFKGTNPTVKAIEEVEKTIGTFEEILVVVKSESFENNLYFLEKFEKNISGSDLIRFVEFERDVKYFEEHALLFLSTEYLKEFNNKVKNYIRDEVEKSLSFNSGNTKRKSPAESVKEITDRIKNEIDKKSGQYNITKHFTADSGRFVALKVIPEKSGTNIRELIKITDFLENELAKLSPEENGISVEVGGRYRDRITEISSIRSDLMSTAFLCIFLLSLTIVIYFKSFLSLLIIMFPLSAGILTAVAVNIIIVTEFNIISAFSFVVLYGLGIDSGIHLLSRYSEERNKGKSKLDSMKDTYTKTVPALISGALTTAIVFASLLLSDFKGFSDFGIVAITGILSALFSFTLFFPVFVFLIEKLLSLKIKPVSTFILSNIFFLITGNKILFSILFLMVTIFSVIVLPEIDFEYDLNKLSFKGKNNRENTIISQYNQLSRKENRDVISSGLASIVLTDSIDESKYVHNELEKIQSNDLRDTKIISFLSIFTFIPSEQEEKLRIIRDTKRWIERKINLFDEDEIETIEKEMLPFLSVQNEVTLEKLPDWIKNRFKDKNDNIGHFITLLLSKNKNDIKAVREIKKDFGTIEIEGSEYKMTASYLLLSDIFDIMHSHSKLLITGALITVFFALAFTFKSFFYALILYIPLISGFLWFFSLLYIFSIKFNLFNIVMLPTIIGIGIDSGIHIYHRFLLKNKNDYMPVVLNYTGGAVLFSALTTLIGFASLIYSSHKGLQTIGLVSCIGISTVTVANLIILPMLADMVSTYRNNKKIIK
jgi:uncharacterized protein